MTQPKVAIVGYRGMVGSVLVNRMLEEDDFALIDATFFSTSTHGTPAPKVGKYDLGVIGDANSVEELSKYDFVITCQGGDYTNAMHPKLREAGWQGYWIDAASALRMKDNVSLILDPINKEQLQAAIANGQKDFAGSNCTVSLMLIGLGGLFTKGLVESAIVSSYQAASGAGAANMRELVEQFGAVYNHVAEDLADRSKTMLDVAAKVQEKLSTDLAAPYFGAPLAASLLPWIDAQHEHGFTKEEWKGHAETNKILGLADHSIKVDSTCVRVGVLRSHSQSITLKLKENLSVEQIEKLIAEHNKWVYVVPNNKEETIHKLTPTAVSGTLNVAVGRVRKLSLGDEYVSIFTVGDQLLWGAAEPLRRMLRLILNAPLDY
ncbi:aspartate-semialdehyde dehydrogenase [Psittacicella melopsittaci]|uniref:Aspartate-semialdehyde dehydrogenase n=1 Tax=Psittacicella melopsittaci TaxID=2028576 RepID=A0A3A1Y8W8_9GAMM|nr:aspartate-semialdehyde dehydrogenase [Psittacicella melopsittaci]RIY33638.1 aspartate-semialdehyde dehydrogenase [Psittacicella melopsittaci]